MQVIRAITNGSEEVPRGAQASVHVFGTGDKMLVKRFKDSSSYDYEMNVWQKLGESQYLMRPLLGLADLQSMVFPLAADGDLLNLSLRFKNMQYLDLVDISKKIVLAVAEIHRQGFLHMDIKPENIVREGKQIWLIDFGLAAPIGKSQRRVGTLRTMAPECLDPKSKVEVTEAADWWSIGCTIFHLFAIHYDLPFSMHYDYFPCGISDNGKNIVWPNETPAKYFPPSLMSLLYGRKGLLSENAQERFYRQGRIESLLLHPFFNNN